MALALNRLKRREYSAFEMKSYLNGKGIEPLIASQVVEELVNGLFIDNKRFARTVARRIIQRRFPHYIENPKIAAKAYQALLRRGFSTEVADQAALQAGTAEEVAEDNAKVRNDF